MMDSEGKPAAAKAGSGAHVLLESAADRLPTPDGVALAIMAAWSDDRTTVQQLARLVQTDPALSGRVLKLANSAAVAGRPVVSVPEAIVRIGMQTVGQLAVAFSLIGKEHSDLCRGFDYQRFWSGSLMMAVLARSLGDATRLAPPEDLFACGLLSRIGKLGLASVYPEAYAEVLKEPEEDLVRREKEAFGVDHNELSEAMLLDFFVPRALAEPVRYLEVPEQSGFARDSRPQKIVLLLHLASQLADMAVRGARLIDRHAALIDAVCAQLGLPEGRIASIFDQALEEWHEWLKLLELPTRAALDDDSLSAGSPSEAVAESTAVPPGAKALLVVLLGDQRLLGKLSDALATLGISARPCDQPALAMQFAMEQSAKVFLITPEHSRFLEMLRHAEAVDSSYVIVVLKKQSFDLEAEAYAAGADDVISAGMTAGQLAPRLLPAVRMLQRLNRWRDDRKELRRIAKELALSYRQQQVLALTDELTGLPNRRAAMDALNRAWSAGQRGETTAGVLVLDLDHFKKINDRYGHAVGDQALRAVAQVLKDSVRGDELVARVGGEEFLLISTRLTPKEAVLVGARLQRRLESARIDAGGEGFSLTASIGIAVREEGMRHAEEIMIAADKALYAAKSAGRNRIALHLRGQVQLLKT